MAAPTICSSTGKIIPSSGTYNWTCANCADSKIIVGGYGRDNRYMDAVGTYQGLGLWSIGSSSTSGFDFGTVLYRTGITGGGSNARQLITAYNDEILLGEMVLDHASALSLVDSFRSTHSWGGGGSNALDPGTKDCLGVVAVTNQGNYASTITVPGISVTTRRTLYDGCRLSVYTFPLLASDGAKNVSIDAGSGGRTFSGALFGAEPAVVGGNSQAVVIT